MSDHDAKVMLILNKIESKKQELLDTEEKSKRKWLTNCVINLNSMVNKNLKTLNKQELLDFTANLITHRDSQKTAAVLLDYDFDIKFNNFDYDDWFEDCKTRLAVLTLKEKTSKLKELESIAESLQSEDLKKKKSLEKLEKELDSLN